MNRLVLSSALCTLAGALIANGQIPSLINYQGRLTDAAGVPVTGSKNFSISLYDSATAGSLLYTESIGAVTLDANGVYSFQFGGAGTSNSQVTETLATTDTATLVYTKALANTGIVENSITVTDGTNTWNQSAGNPGAGATATANTIAGFVIGATITNGGSGYTSPPAVTIIGNGSGATATAVLTEGVVTGITITSAGSGYTGTPTITIAPPVIPFRVDYNSGTITTTYSAAPTAGAAITASYRYGTSGITGALSSGAEHWMAVSVDGVMQGTRQKVLTVPFAVSAGKAETATRLERIVKTCYYVVMTPNDPTDRTPGTTRRNLPASVAPRVWGSNGTGDSFYQKIASEKIVVHSISAKVAMSAPDGLLYPPDATIEVAAYSSAGVRSVVARGSLNKSGVLLIEGPVVLDHSKNEYVIECSIGTGAYSNGTTSNVTTMWPIEVKYEN